MTHQDQKVAHASIEDVRHLFSSDDAPDSFLFVEYDGKDTLDAFVRRYREYADDAIESGQSWKTSLFLNRNLYHPEDRLVRFYEKNLQGVDPSCFEGYEDKRHVFFDVVRDQHKLDLPTPSPAIFTPLDIILRCIGHRDVRKKILTLFTV
jgi:hypothetical protein